MKPRTAAEERFARLRSEPEYGEAYPTASRRVEMFDEVMRSLDARRQELGLTKADLADRANMPAAAVRRLFSQQQKNPTLTTLVAIADALNLQISTVPRDSNVDRSAARSSRRLGPSEPNTEAPSRISGTRRRTA
jgi:transcriptional regulator with XRE-family HTH domain